MNARNTSPLLWAAVGALGALFGCSDVTPVPLESLRGPRAIAVVRGEVCVDVVTDGDGNARPTTRACAEGERGGIGLVVNEHADRVAVLNMNIRRPDQIDVDGATPGVTHIPVGRGPVDVAANSAGTVAYTVDQGDQALSVISLWGLKALTAQLALPGVPIKAAARPGTDAVVVALAEPSLLWMHPGVTCDAPAQAPADLRTYDADADCSGADAAPTQVSLPGVPVDVRVHPRGHEAYVAYADRPFLSIVALSADHPDACIGGGQAPCEVARVGLVFGCSDGIDNDGDGFADTLDSQCFGPMHAEDSTGISRRFTGSCADGEDNDGDGFTDRDDPDCLNSEQGDEGFVSNPVVRACGDTEDQDGDGLADFPLDPQCYGFQGRTESPAQLRTGFAGMGLDELGTFLYIVDTPRNQILVVDTQRRALIDAPRSAEPAGDIFTTTLGVTVGRSPTAVVGRVQRTVVPDSRVDQADTHALVRYDYGAYVATDNGFVYYVDTMVSYCDVFEPDGLLSADDFRDTEKLAKSQESLCLKTPVMPVTDPSRAPVASCKQVVLCQACVEANDPTCVDCAGMDMSTLAADLAVCQSGERRFSEGLVRGVHNPRLSLRDVFDQTPGRVTTRAACDIPDVMQPRLDEAAARLGVPGAIDCGSQLLPQPISLTLGYTGALRPSNYLDAQRVDLLERVTLEMELDAEGQGTREVIDIKTYDQRLRDETWTIEYEGVLPDTQRSGGLVDADDPAWFDVGTLDLCAAGVKVGDLLTIKSTPGPDDDTVPAECAEYASSDADTDETFRTYSIVEVEASYVKLAPLVGEGERYASKLPTRACFPRGLSFEVRAAGSWLVSGDLSGAISDQRAVDGQCVAAYGAGRARRSSRVKTGEVYHGPYFSFRLYAGEVEPTRGLRYDVAIQRNFIFSSAGDSRQLNPQTKNPRQIVYAEGLPGGRYVMVPDPSDDVIYIKNLSNSDQPYYLR